MKKEILQETNCKPELAHSLAFFSGICWTRKDEYIVSSEIKPMSKNEDIFSWRWTSGPAWIEFKKFDPTRGKKQVAWIRVCVSRVVGWSAVISVAQAHNVAKRLTAAWWKQEAKK